MRYQTQLPTIGLVPRDNHQAAITIPSGKILDVVGRAQDERFVIAEVDGQRLLVFETDLNSRCIAQTGRNAQTAGL